MGILQNLQDVPKAVLRGKFIEIWGFLKKQEKFQISNLTYHLKDLKKNKKKHKVGRRKETVKIRGEINKIQTQRKINKKDQWYQELFFFFEKTKILINLSQAQEEKREWTQINKIRNERGEKTINTKEIQKILREY